MQKARENFSQTLDLNTVEQILSTLQKQQRGIKIEGGAPIASRLDEIRNDLQKFVAETHKSLREEVVAVTPPPEGELKDQLVVTKKQSKYKSEKVARLLSTRYGRTCFDVIIAKTPDTACLHEV